MDEQAKIMLYKQLSIFEDISKVKGEKLISWEKYNTFDAKEALLYASDYRDRCYAYMVKKSKKGVRRPLYIEMPEMDLHGIDLHDFYLHDFMPGYAKERNNGKKVFITTKINLNGTNCVINMATIRPIIISLDRRNNKGNYSRYKKM